MGLFDSWRAHRAKQDGAETEAMSVATWEPPERGECECLEHVEDLLRLELPLSSALGESLEGPMTVEELLESSAIDAEPTEVDERWIEPPGGPPEGPFYWNVWVGDEARLCYDDEAPLQLNQAILERPGVEAVEWADREVFYIRGERLCRSGVLAVLARALADPRVRVGG